MNVRIKLSTLLFAAAIPAFFLAAIRLSPGSSRHRVAANYYKEKYYFYSEFALESESRYNNDMFKIKEFESGRVPSDLHESERALLREPDYGKKYLVIGYKKMAAVSLNMSKLYRNNAEFYIPLIEKHERAISHPWETLPPDPPEPPFPAYDVRPGG